MVERRFSPPYSTFFSDILERNNDYSDTVVTFFILEVPDYKSVMLIYFIYEVHFKSNAHAAKNQSNSFI